MELHHHQQPQQQLLQSNHHPYGGGSISNSTTSDVNNNSHSSSSISTYNNHRNNHHNGNDPMHSWWESVSKARSRIHSLLSVLPLDDSLSLASLADSDRPARSLLESLEAYTAITASLSSPLSGSGEDSLCQWLYDTFQSSDPDLRLVVLSFVPLLTGVYLSRVHSCSTIDASAPSLAGFEAVLLALYGAETKSRAGKPLLVSIPDLSQPSLYHTPAASNTDKIVNTKPSVGILSPPLEPHLAVKSTKRASIVGVALDSFFKQISQMPSWSKIELCRCAAAWAGEVCACVHSLDRGGGDNDADTASCVLLENGRVSNGGADLEIESVSESIGRMGFGETAIEARGRGIIPLPWELWQPMLKILGHCLLAPLNPQEVRDEAAIAVRRLYARASHDILPQGILATRSLIQIDNRGRAAVRAAAISDASSNANTPSSKAKKPEILLVSK